MNKNGLKLNSDISIYKQSDLRLQPYHGLLEMPYNILIRF